MSEYLARPRRATEAGFDVTEYVLQFNFERPKYWTGQMLEHWPVYVADETKAHRFDTKQAAQEVLAGFRARGFDVKVVAAP